MQGIKSLLYLHTSGVCTSLMAYSRVPSRPSPSFRTRYSGNVFNSLLNLLFSCKYESSTPPCLILFTSCSADTGQSDQSHSLHAKQFKLSCWTVQHMITLQTSTILIVSIDQRLMQKANRHEQHMLTHELAPKPYVRTLRSQISDSRQVSLRDKRRCIPPCSKLTAVWTPKQTRWSSTTHTGQHHVVQKGKQHTFGMMPPQM